MEIREIELDEIEGVYELIDQYDRPQSPRPNQSESERIYLELRQSGGCVLGAIESGIIIGTCTVNMCPNFSWSGRPYAIIENVIVERSKQNNGIGKSLLAKAKKYAKNKGCYKVALLTGTKQKHILDFYRSAGFDGTKTGFQARFNA